MAVAAVAAVVVTSCFIARLLYICSLDRKKERHG